MPQAKATHACMWLVLLQHANGILGHTNGRAAHHAEVAEHSVEYRRSAGRGAKPVQLSIPSCLTPEHQDEYRNLVELTLEKLGDVFDDLCDELQGLECDLAV